MLPFAKTLNRRVEILKADGKDELGQPNTSHFEVFGSAWANVRNLRGVEALRAGAVNGKITCSIRMRYRTDIVSGMRIADGVDRYVVRSVLPDKEQMRHVDLLCEAVR